MIKTNAKKICIVVTCLGGGGAERSSALLSQMLDNFGYDVHIVSVLDKIDYAYKGKLFNLGKLKQKNDTLIGRFNRLLIFKKYLKTNNIDIVIDGRARVQAYREFIITKFVYTLPVVYVLHNYNHKKTFTPYKRLNKFLYKNKKMITVSKTAENYYKKTYALEDVTTIYNGFDFESINKSASLEVSNSLNNYIIYFGRLDDGHKNLKLLFNAFKLSKLIKHSIKILVLGSGPDEVSLIKYVEEIDISDFVVFHGFEKNPYPFVQNAMFTVLTSRYEGFPMVIPESLALGVPVISVDCKSGPSEVIINEQNGLLVENYDTVALANAMNRFMLDKELYLHCKSNARASVKKFSMENIGKQWQAILK
jgi:glycosyltransferase involved in cell wall biosynthesis